MQEEILEANFFDSFISNPLATDTILDIYPVCGPLSVFKNYKFKVKIQTGSIKRGTAFKIIT